MLRGMANEIEAQKHRANKEIANVRCFIGRRINEVRKLETTRSQKTLWDRAQILLCNNGSIAVMIKLVG